MAEKICLLTGGSGLLGREIRSQLRKQGWRVINADVIRANDADEDTLICDITSAASVDEMLRSVYSKCGHIDGLINNAYPRTKDWGLKFEKIPLESWKQNIDWQINSHFYLTQKVVEKMKERGAPASIVNIASVYGMVGPDFSIYEGTEMTCPAAYSVIKGGMIAFTRYLASYLGPNNIRVNSVAPGGIFDNQNESFVQKYSKKTPMGRMGRPEDIAPVVCHLMSDGAAYITGQNIAVDGGWTSI